jgi:hypothetical protein
MSRYREPVRRLAFLLVTVLLLPAGSAASSASGASVSGLRGIVTLAPSRPVCSVGESCTKPGVGVTVVFRRNGRAVAKVTAQKGGIYRIVLRPGRYAVVAPRYRIGSGVTPSVVRVPIGRMKRVDFVVDTGIQ